MSLHSYFCLHCSESAEPPYVLCVTVNGQDDEAWTRPLDMVWRGSVLCRKCARGAFDEEIKEAGA